MRDVDCDLLITLETGLLAPSGRRDISKLEALLHPDYQETGLSGKLWTRGDVIEALARETGPRQIVASDFKITDAGALEACLTYRTHEIGSDGRVARQAQRRSVWRRESADANWRILLHEAWPERG
jgi:hypothetical protein